MAGTQSVGGLVSGLDTTTIISQLMQLESQPQQALKTKQTATQNLVTALQALNTKVSSLGDAATQAATASSWQALTASSTDSSVTAAASSVGDATSITFAVKQTAQTQVSLVGATSVADLLRGNGSMTFTAADGTETSVPTDGLTSADAIARAITASGAGVNAVAVQVNGGYQLQLTAGTSGTAGAFQASVTADDGTGTQVTTGAIAARTARDAQITLWPDAKNADGTPASTTVTSSSNTFSDVVPGLTFTVSQPTSADVTVSTSRDDTAVTKLGSNLVSQLNLVLGEIASQTKATTTTASDGTTSLSAGILGGESDVRFLQSAVADAGSGAVTYGGQLVSPSSVGIVINDDGTFTFDQDAFAASLAADPAKTQAVVAAVAQRVASVATTYSDPIDGLITSNITQQQSEVQDLGDQISNWDVRLQLRQTTLEQQYSAMETALSKLQSQSSYLTSTLAALSSSSSSSSSSS